MTRVFQLRAPHTQSTRARKANEAAGKPTTGHTATKAALSRVSSSRRRHPWAVVDSRSSRGTGARSAHTRSTRDSANHVPVSTEGHHRGSIPPVSTTTGIARLRANHPAARTALLTATSSSSLLLGLARTTSVPGSAGDEAPVGSSAGTGPVTGWADLGGSCREPAAVPPAPRSGVGGTGSEYVIGQPRREANRSYSEFTKSVNSSGDL